MSNNCNLWLYCNENKFNINMTLIKFKVLKLIDKLNFSKTFNLLNNLLFCFRNILYVLNSTSDKWTKPTIMKLLIWFYFIHYLNYNTYLLYVKMHFCYFIEMFIFP